MDPGLTNQPQPTPNQPRGSVGTTNPANPNPSIRGVGRGHFLFGDGFVETNPVVESPLFPGDVWKSNQAPSQESFG